MYRRPVIRVRLPLASSERPPTCVSLVLCEILMCQAFFFTSLMGFMNQPDHFAMQCNSFFAIEMLYIHYNVFVSNKSQCVREQYFKIMLWMCNTNFSFITLILTKWMLAIQVYMLQSAEYCVSSSNMSMLKNTSGESIKSVSVLFK